MFLLAPSEFSADTFSISACLNSVPYWREFRGAGGTGKKPDKAKSTSLRLLNLLNLIAINQVQKLHDDSCRRTPDVPPIVVEVVDGFTVGREISPITCMHHATSSWLPKPAQRKRTERSLS